MNDIDLTRHRIRLALHDEGRVRSAYFAAHRRASELRSELRQIEVRLTQAEMVLRLTGSIPWPPLFRFLRPPTLHEAMRIVLEAKGNPWMRTSALAIAIAKRGLYCRRDGLPATTKDVSARAATYSSVFERSGYNIRLRGVPQTIEDNPAPTTTDLDALLFGPGDSPRPDHLE